MLYQDRDGETGVDYTAPIAHDVFVDAVVDHLFQKHINAVVGVRTVSHAPDIHAGAQPDMFQGIKGFDLALIISARGGILK